MHAVSAAIVALSGAVIFAAGSLNGHGDTQIGVMLVGSIVGLVGFGNWWALLQRPPRE